MVNDMALDLRFFSYIQTVAEQGSFRRAADVLGLQQSTLSRRVQLLERQLGLSLFERSHTGVRLTQDAENFIREAAIGVDYLTRATGNLRAARIGEKGVLRIGFLAALSSGFTRSILARCREKQPGVRVILQLGTPEQLIAQVIGSQMDLAFVTGEPTIVGCTTLSLWTEGILAVLPGNHRHATKGSVSWAELREEAFMVAGAGPTNEIANHIVRRLAGLGFQPRIELHDVGRDDLIHLVAIGYGVAVTGSSSLETTFPGVVLVPIDGEEETLISSAVWSQKNANPALKRMLTLTRELAARWP